MKIDANFDLSGQQERFGLSQKQLAYGVANAINRTAKHVQEQEKANARRKFHLRGGSGEQLVLRSVAKIFQFASPTKGTPFAEIGIDEPKPRMLLTVTERGGEKHPFLGHNVAVPITGSPARPSMDAPVPGPFRIANLNLQPRLSGADRAHMKSIKGGSAKETRAMRRDYANSKGKGLVRIGRATHLHDPRSWHLPAHRAEDHGAPV